MWTLRPTWCRRARPLAQLFVGAEEPAALSMNRHGSSCPWKGDGKPGDGKPGDRNLLQVTGACLRPHWNLLVPHIGCPHGVGHRLKDFSYRCSYRCLQLKMPKRESEPAKRPPSPSLFISAVVQEFFSGPRDELSNLFRVLGQVPWETESEMEVSTCIGVMGGTQKGVPGESSADHMERITVGALALGGLKGSRGCGVQSLEAAFLQRTNVTFAEAAAFYRETVPEVVSGKSFQS